MAATTRALFLFHRERLNRRRRNERLFLRRVFLPHSDDQKNIIIIIIVAAFRGVRALGAREIYRRLEKPMMHRFLFALLLCCFLGNGREARLL